MLPLTQTEKMRLVQENPKWFEEYCNILSEEKTKYSMTGHKVRGKRKGIQRLIERQKQVAAQVYDNHN